MTDDLKCWLDDEDARCSYQRILHMGITAAKFADVPPYVSERQEAILHAAARIQQLETENKALRERVEELEGE